MTATTKTIETTVTAPSENPQICVCFDVYEDEIVAHIKAGETEFDKIRDNTYACQGCGSCAPKIEALISRFSK